MQEWEGLEESVYYRMLKRLLKSGDTPTTVWHTGFHVSVPNTEVENKVITTREKKKNQTLGLRDKQVSRNFFSHMY